MRESIRSLKRSPTYEIKEMNEKSNFSINDQVEEKPQPNMMSNPKKLDTSLGQKNNGDYQMNGCKKQGGECVSSKTAVVSSLTKNTDMINNNNNNNNKLLFQLQTIMSQSINSTIKQTHNINTKATSYTYGFYILIFVYLFYTHLILLPSMSGNSNINNVTAVVLAIGLLIDFTLIIVCYQQARRVSPGYPCRISDMMEALVQGGNREINADVDAKKTQNIHKQQQQLINDIKNNTIQLLIQKINLKQAYEKHTTQQNLIKLQQFEFKFFVESIKYCQKCNNIKLPRVRHCTQCNQCVQRMDHHCVWLNNCVGKGNHKLFMLFLVFLLIGLTFYIVVGVVDFVASGEGESLCKFIQQDYGSLVKILHLLLILFAGMLWFYYAFVFFEQLYLIANNLTFVESLSKVLLEKKPWKKQSICENFQQVFGRMCWLCPVQGRDENDGNEYNNKGSKKAPSVQLVQEVIPQNKIHCNNLTSFQSQNQLRHERNQI